MVDDWAWVGMVDGRRDGICTTVSRDSYVWILRWDVHIIDVVYGTPRH
jgi:hypothetical protein